MQSLRSNDQIYSQQNLRVSEWADAMSSKAHFAQKQYAAEAWMVVKALVGPIHTSALLELPDPACP